MSSGNDHQHHHVDCQATEAYEEHVMRTADIDNVTGNQRAGNGGDGLGQAGQAQHERVMRQRIYLPAQDDALRLQRHHRADAYCQQQAKIAQAQYAYRKGGHTGFLY